MDSANRNNSKEYSQNTTQTSAWLKDMSTESDLTPEQQVALIRVLQETPKYVPAEEPEITYSPKEKRRQKKAAPKSKGYGHRSVNRDGRYEPRKRKKRSTQSVVLTVLLIAVLAGAGFLGWFYWWTTHATFEYSLQPLVILEGQDVAPEDFLSPGENMESISAVFRNPGFRPSPGKQDVQLTLSMGWRGVETGTSLYVLTTVNEMEHEFAETGPELKAAGFLTNADTVDIPFAIDFVEEPMLLEDYPVGDYTLKLIMNEIPFDVLLSVKDTTPPEATPVDIDILIGEEIKPEDFVKDVSDASDHLPILITYFEEEADNLGRDQTVAIKIEDHYGNYTVVNAKLTVKHNTEAPVIEGTDTILNTFGDTILFLQGVTATDDFGRDITDRIVVDSSDVNTSVVGTYTVRYKVTDFTGLTFEIEETVHILDIDFDYVNSEVDRELAGIINDGMTQLQQVRAIWSWIRTNITYAQNRDRPETAYEGAYRALRERRGNCYIFYSISEMMFTRAGIPNMMIERIEGTPTRHRWNLVNPDGLGWHHFDSYPTRLNLGLQMAFFTSSQAASFTRQIANLEERAMSDYYTYDASKYPEIVQ